MKIYTLDQRSDAWRQLRAGKLTGSAAKDMLAKIKTGEAAARRDLRYRLVAERLTGQPQESAFVNAEMQWGIDQEPAAIAAYETATGRMVQAIGFCEHDSLLAGTSPDGFVEGDGILSVKCPKTATHIRYLRDGGEPSEHRAQNTHELWLTGRAWIDFVSYDPRLPEALRLFIVRVTRTSDDLRAYDMDARGFLREVETECQCLRSSAGVGAVLTEALA